MIFGTNVQKVYLGNQEINKILLQGIEVFSSITTDPYSDYVTLLLHMNGLSGSQTFTDSSTNNFELTAFDNTNLSTVIKKYGTASVYFDGNGDYLETNEIALGTDNFTVECWIYPLNVSGESAIFNQGNSDTTGNFIFGFSNGKLLFYANNSSRIFSNATIQTNQWTHIALLRQSNVYYVFINGNLDGTVSATLDHFGLPFKIADGYGGIRFYNGYIDELRITKGVARYTSNFTPPQQQFSDPSDPHIDNVSLLLHMDGSNGSQTFTDSSSNNFTLSAFGNTQISTSVKKFGNSAAYFDGSGDYLSASKDPVFDMPEDFTIEFWHYPLTFSTGEPVISLYTNQNFGNLDTTPGIMISLQSPLGRYQVSFGNASFASLTEPLLNQWNHCALVRSNNLLSFYSNGIKIGGDLTFSDALTSSSCLIGATLTNNTSIFDEVVGYYQGYIDEFRITNGVARYTSNFVPQTAPFANPVTITPPIFTPASIPGLVTRFNADSGVAVSGGLITSWTDQQNGIVATAFNGPTLLTGTFNGRNAVSLDGLNDFFTGNFNTGLASDTGRTFVIIGKYNTATGQTGMFDGSTDLQAYIFKSSGSLYYNNGPQIGPIVGNFTTNYFIQIINTSDSSGTTVYRVNGVQGASGSMNRPAMTGFNIGRRGNQGEYANCNIVELLVYNRSLTLTEMQSLETYANTI